MKIPPGNDEEDEEGFGHKPTKKDKKKKEITGRGGRKETQKSLLLRFPGFYALE